jgi:hypothetical protein
MHEQTGFDIRLDIALRQSTDYCVDDALYMQAAWYSTCTKYPATL